MLMMIVLAAVAVGAFFLVRPKNGTLLVTVAGPGQTAVEDVKVLVDGETQCSASPCRVTIATGAHTIRVNAPGFAKSADRPVVVKPGAEEIVDFSLAPESGTGIRASAKAKGVRLFVDGVDRGELPVSIEDLTPGTHEIRIAGNDAYKPYTEQITVAAGEMKQVEPSLELLKGVARVELGANAAGAQVTLECGKNRKMLAPPTTVEIDTQQSCRLLAGKTGFEVFAKELRFANGEPEQTVTVSLVEKSTDPVPGPAPVLPTRPKAPDIGGGAKAVAGMGTIRINSIPVSNVLVDGRPVGQTPTQATVPAGNHTVTFVHPEKGRKAVGVSVQAGGNATAIVRF
jgi:serine/threonine-protein kinase